MTCPTVTRRGTGLPVSNSSTFRVPEDAHLATPTPNEFVAEDLCESLLSFVRDVSSIAARFDHVHRGDACESGLSIVHDDRRGSVCDHVLCLFEQLFVRTSPFLFGLEHERLPP
jgi:hypothetical protein